ncbi:31678_t:CDS:2 [Racocetra persica]|uniref:31678_t:CDS:1 n=1 Tax=Racocetra persica TaxID=160502 RepID=A0ACA9RIA4_9GLOM|nr:31678_t:CDS:2 [Racocetra persica]
MSSQESGCNCGDSCKCGVTCNCGSSQTKTTDTAPKRAFVIRQSNGNASKKLFTQREQRGYGK